VRACRQNGREVTRADIALPRGDLADVA